MSYREDNQSSDLYSEILRARRVNILRPMSAAGHSSHSKESCCPIASTSTELHRLQPCSTHTPFNLSTYVSMQLEEN